MPKTRLPEDFKVEDSDREWAVRKGYPLYMPDVFLRDFCEYHELHRTKHHDWRLAFKRHIRMNSPTGGYYKWYAWERKLHDAKNLESERYNRRGEVQRIADVKTPMPAATREIVERMRAK